MTKGRLSFLLFLLILLGPVVALNLGGANVTGWLAERSVQLAPPSAEELTTQEDERSPEDPYQWLNDRPELRDIFIPDALTEARHVAIEKVMTAEELLRPGEAAPDPAFAELYAAARAPAQLIAYCEEVVATIGQTCDVLHTQTRENREGKWVMNGRLAFIPVADLGDPSVVEGGQLLSARAALPYDGDLRPANEPATRAEMLRQAQSVCDALRAELGNCVLTRVTFEVEELWITDLEALPPGTNPQRVAAQVEYTVYADPLQTDANGFADLVEGLVNRS